MKLLETGEKKPMHEEDGTHSCARCRGTGRVRPKEDKTIEIRCVRFKKCGHRSTLQGKNLELVWDLRDHPPSLGMMVLAGESRPGEWAKSWIAFWLSAPRREKGVTAQQGSLIIKQPLYGPFFVCTECMAPVGMKVGMKLLRGDFSMADLSILFGEEE